MPALYQFSRRVWVFLNDEIRSFLWYVQCIIVITVIIDIVTLLFNVTLDAERKMVYFSARTPFGQLPASRSHSCAHSDYFVPIWYLQTHSHVHSDFTMYPYGIYKHIHIYILTLLCTHMVSTNTFMCTFWLYHAPIWYLQTHSCVHSYITMYPYSIYKHIHVYILTLLCTHMVSTNTFTCTFRLYHVPI